VFVTYLHQGIEHIVFGFDHLLFVAGLMLIVRGWRKLVKAVTAFTVAHSITLTSATLGWATLPSRPVEAMIAISIVMVAAEVVRMERGQNSLAIVSPWTVAFAFGLLHGFGFAGALGDLGLPQGDIPLALLAFNIGVELGQLAFIAMTMIGLYSIRQLVNIPRHAIARPPMQSASSRRSGASSVWTRCSCEGGHNEVTGGRAKECCCDCGSSSAGRSAGARRVCLRL
jgi:hydrogenase/urease accessory protein HupE